MKNKYLFLALLAYSFGGFAQVSTESDEELDEIIIEENRLQIPFHKSTRNVQVLTKEDIQKLPVSSLNEVLSYVGGVDIRQRGPFGSQADISIDGGSFEQTMILWNGVKMGDAQTAHHSMNLPIPLEAIERIEVLKGPAARIYRSEEHTSELQSRPHLVCRLLLEKKKYIKVQHQIVQRKQL